MTKQHFTVRHDDAGQVCAIDCDGWSVLQLVPGTRNAATADLVARMLNRHLDVFNREELRLAVERDLIPDHHPVS